MCVLRNALRYAYFDTSLGVLTEAPPTCTETVPKLCMYHAPQRSKALDRFMYRPPSAPDGTTANEVIVSFFPLTPLVSRPCVCHVHLHMSYVNHADSVAPPSKASLADCPARLSIEEYKAFGTIPFGRHIIYSNTLTQLAASAIDFTKVETQCLILQTIQQVGLPSGVVERTNHAVLVEKSFGQSMIEQLEIALGRMSENWKSWAGVSQLLIAGSACV